MDNKILFGLEQLHVAFIDEESMTPPEWESPIAIPGVVGFSSSPEGDELKFFADNKLYYHQEVNNGYTGELETALIPDTILADMLGLSVDDNDMLIEETDGIGKEFAIMGQVQGDAKNRRFVYYRCKASRPGQDSSTKEETLTPSTQTIALTMLPIEHDEKKIVKAVMELGTTNESEYAAFFDAVPTPVVVE